jgi:membrane associated rhomboid family serine protease
MTFFEALAVLLANGGIGVACSRLLEWLETSWLWFKDLRPDLKRAATFIITVLTAVIIGGLATWAQVLMDYAPPPPTWRAWVEVLFKIASGAWFAVMTGQLTHGAREETKRRDAEMKARWKIVMGE